MSKKAKCTSCDNKGLSPWCPQCFKYGMHTAESRAEAIRKAREEASLVRMSHEERHLLEQRQQIERFRYLGNTKDLKAMLSGMIRSKKLLTGRLELDAVINSILTDVIAQVHVEIDSEELKTIAEVVTRFWSLLGDPSMADYRGHLPPDKGV